MIDPPEQRTYARGDTFHATLLIRWRDEFDAVVLEFHKLYSPFSEAFGNRIELQSRSLKRIAEEPQPYTEVELEGMVPEWINPGTYVCRYVRCSVPGRGWVTLFEDLHQVTLRVRRMAPPAPQSKEGAEFLGIDFLKLSHHFEIARNQPDDTIETICCGLSAGDILSRKRRHAPSDQSRSRKIKEEQP